MYRPNARPDGHHLSFLINTQVFERVKLNESWIRISTMVDPTSICHTFGSLHRNQLNEKCAISVGKLTATHFVYSNFTPAIFVFTSFIIFSLFFFLSLHPLRFLDILSEILSNWSNVIVHPNNQCGRRSYWPYAGLATSTQEKLLRFEFEKEKWRNPIHLIKLSIWLFEEDEWNACKCVESVCVCFVHSHHTAFLCPWMIVDQQQQRHEWNFDLWFI